MIAILNILDDVYKEPPQAVRTGPGRKTLYTYWKKIQNPGKVYTPNGARECERRMRQAKARME